MDVTNQRIAIIGGCGHVGLPLGVKFELAGAKVDLIDVNQAAVDTVNSGKFPFVEKEGDAELKLALKKGLRATTDKTVAVGANVIVFVIGTPVDEHLNPKLSQVVSIIDEYEEVISAGALIVMRSTLYPGTMEHLRNRLVGRHKKVQLAFCPERVAQGVALEEIHTLPQIVSAFDEESFNTAYQLFAAIAPSVIRLTPIEAELTKLMANSWRYLEFAIANQFYMIAEKSGVDFYRIYQALRHDYPRANGYKAPGFAAGPCLFKDTMQLASFFDNQFYMGHAAMLVNEGLANIAVDKVSNIFNGDLWGKTVGLLGMAFKANNDDIRESLSFKIKKGLEFAGAKVLCHDPYLPEYGELEGVLNADALVISTPHQEYLKLEFKAPVIDVWGIFNKAPIEVLPGYVDNQNVGNNKRSVINE